MPVTRADIQDLANLAIVDPECFAAVSEIARELVRATRAHFSKIEKPLDETPLASIMRKRMLSLDRWHETVRNIPYQARQISLSWRLKREGRTEPTAEELAAVEWDRRR